MWELLMKHPRCGFAVMGGVFPRVCTRGYRQKPIPWAFSENWLQG